MVAMDMDNHLLIAFVVNPGTPRSFSFLIALTSVLVGGEKKIDKGTPFSSLICHVVYTVRMLSCVNGAIGFRFQCTLRKQ